jgi:hypothetical protein
MAIAGLCQSLSQRASGALDADFPAPADGRNVVPSAGFAIAREKAPGFAIFLRHDAKRAAGAGIEANAFALAEGFDGNDVPNIFRDHVADEKIDFFDGVDLAVGSGGFDTVASVGITSGGFDLDAEQIAGEADDGIVRLAVSPGNENAEIESSGTREEGCFGGFSATLASGIGDGVDG